MQCLPKAQPPFGIIPSLKGRQDSPKHITQHIWPILETPMATQAGASRKVQECSYPQAGVLLWLCAPVIPLVSVVQVARAAIPLGCSGGSTRGVACTWRRNLKWPPLNLCSNLITVDLHVHRAQLQLLEPKLECQGREFDRCLSTDARALHLGRSAVVLTKLTARPWGNLYSCC